MASAVGRVVVVGSGLAGLSAAWMLKACGLEVVVLEAAAEPGGRLRCERVEEFTFDPAERLEEMHRLQRVLHEREPVTALFFFDAPLAYDKRLVGVRPSALGYASTIHGPREWRWVESKDH